MSEQRGQTFDEWWDMAPTGVQRSSIAEHYAREAWQAARAQQDISEVEREFLEAAKNACDLDLAWHESPTPGRKEAVFASFKVMRQKPGVGTYRKGAPVANGGRTWSGVLRRGPDLETSRECGIRRCSPSPAVASRSFSGLPVGWGGRRGRFPVLAGLGRS